MTDQAIQPAGADSSRFWGALRRFPAWAGNNLPALVLSAGVAGVTAYVVNVWIMAVRYDGYVVPSGSGTTGEGNLLQGGLFWALLPMLLMSIVGYRRAVGGPRFWRDVRGLPLALVSLVRADGDQARINLLWGAAAGMTAALVIGPSLGLVMGAGILVAAPTVVGNVMSSTAYKALTGVLGKVSPSSSLSPETGMLSTAVGLIGGGASLAVGFVVTDTTVKLVAALALAAVAFALSNRRPVPPPAVMIVLVVAAAIWSLDELLRASVAFADDGGYIECGESWSEWWSRCEGADSVRTYAGIGAVSAGVGGGAGSFLGSVVGQATVNGDLGDGDPALADYVDQLMSGPEFDDFRSQYPDLADGPDTFETYVGWRDQQGLDVPPLPDGWEWETDGTDPSGGPEPQTTGDAGVPPSDDVDVPSSDDVGVPSGDDADVPPSDDGVPSGDDADVPPSDDQGGGPRTDDGEGSSTGVDDGVPPSDDVGVPSGDDADVPSGDDADVPPSDDQGGGPRTDDGEGSSTGVDDGVPPSDDGVPSSDDVGVPSGDDADVPSGDDADVPPSDDQGGGPRTDDGEGSSTGVDDGVPPSDDVGVPSGDDADVPSGDDADVPSGDDADVPPSDDQGGGPRTDDGEGSSTGVDDGVPPSDDGVPSGDDADVPSGDDADVPSGDDADVPPSDDQGGAPRTDDGEGSSTGVDDGVPPSDDDGEVPGDDAGVPQSDDAEVPGDDGAVPSGDDADVPGDDADVPSADGDEASPDGDETQADADGDAPSTDDAETLPDGDGTSPEDGGEDGAGDDDESRPIRVPRGENDPERTDDGEPERTDDGEPERTDDGEPERTDDGEPGRTDDADDGHRVDPDRVAEGPDGRPLVDPVTNEPLRVDEDGNVKYGDEWMRPEEAAERAGGDQAWAAEKAEGVRKVEEFRDLLDEYQRTDDPEYRQALEAALRDRAIEINQDYQAKAELKAQGRTELTEAFDDRIQGEYQRVDEDFVGRQNEMGIKRGGRDMSTDDITDIRNASSAGTAGMDRDLALQQQRVNEMLDRLERVEPGTPEAQRLAGEIESARSGIDYERWLADKGAQLEAAEPGSRQAAQIESEITRIEADAGRIKNAYTSDLQRQLDAATPGSPEAQRLQTELTAAEGRVAGREQVTFGEARAADRITVDYDKAHAALTRQLADAPAGSQEAHRIQEALGEIERHSATVKTNYVDQLERQLAGAAPDSPEAQRIQAELTAAEGRMAGRADVEISTQRWNDIAQPAYDGAYRDVTGGDSARAFQGVTQSGNPEAYRDLEVLANDPANRPFAAESGAQTSDVTGYKATENERMVSEGVLSQGSSAQETARGLSKDLGTKLLPEMRLDPNIDPAKLDQFERMNDVLQRAGRGEIPPGQVDGALRAAVPEIPGLTLDRATDLTVSNLDAATRWQAGDAERVGAPERVGGPERTDAPERVGGPERTDAPERAGGPERTDAPERAGGPERTDAPEGPRGMSTMGTLSDIGTTQHYAEQNMERGMDPVEATTVAIVQTGAGNAAMASGVADPRSSMIGQALLPNELRGALPDQVVENFVGTGYQAGSAAVDSLSESIRTGQLDTTAIDEFATGVADREGTDFFTGYARAAQLAGDESARTDGGNVFSDLRQIHETGVGREMVEQGMVDFEASVARGEHGAPLEGWSHIARTVSEWTADPGYEAESLWNDLNNMWEHGVGDDYWSDAVDTTTSAIKRTPLLGTIAQGYEELATGIGESGVTGFASEMAEGAWALGAEGVDAAANSASNAAAWVRSWF